MSLLGEIHKVSGGIRESVNSMAQSGLATPDGTIKGTKKIIGYVCAIHEEGELAGTIDVQEFNYEPGEDTLEGVGHHQGVLLSAIQDCQDGILIVPMLFSEVVIVQNPLDGTEYVLMYSHAKRISLSAKSLKSDNDGEVKIGVTEVEDFVEMDDGLDKDCDELESTKNASSTTYTSTSITSQVTSPDDENGVVVEQTATKQTITVGKTTITIDGDNVSIETDGKVSMKVGGTSIEEEDGKINIKTDQTVLEASNCEIKGSNLKINGSNVTITGGNLITQGTSSVDLNGPFNAIKVCPFSGAPHCGSTVVGT